MTRVALVVACSLALAAGMVAAAEPATARDARPHPLVARLASRDPDERLRALDELSRAPREPALRALAEAIRGDDPFLVRYALVALGELHDPRSRPALEGVARDPRTAEADRFHAVAALARVHSAGASPIPLARALEDPSPAVRLAAAAGLLAGAPQHVAVVAARAEGPDLVARLGGAAPLDGPPLRRLEHAGVTLATDVADERRIARAARHLAAFRDAVARFLDAPPAAPIRVRLFADRLELARHGAVHDAHFAQLGTSYYSFLVREVVAHDEPADEPALLRRLRHEVAHAILDRWLGQHPAWLGEGLALVLERALPGEDGALRVEPHDDWEPLVPAGAGVASVVALDDGAFRDARAAESYALAWALGDLLLRDRTDAGRARLARIVRAVRAGAGASPIAPPDRVALDERWRARRP